MELFPEVDRVIYQQNPLAQVACRVHYPELLEIRAEQPVEFHRAIRDSFPIVERTVVDDDESTPAHQFMSPEGDWKVALTPTFLEIATTAYERWEDFSEKSFHIVDVLRDSYDFGRLAHLELRYLDVIQREPLDLDADWHELLSDEIFSPVMKKSDFFARVNRYRQQMSFLLDEERESQASLDLTITELGSPPEPTAVIDLALHQPNSRSPEDAEKTLIHLHEYSGRIFRGCISEKLHEALEPEPA